MLNTKVIVTQPIHEKGMVILKNFVKDVVVAPDSSIETIGKYLDESVEGVIVRYNPFTKELMDKAPNLKVIGRHGIGLETVDVDYATKKGIMVVNTPAAATVSVAEHTVAMILALAKRLLISDLELRKGNYYIKSNLGCTDIENKWLGIIGMGKIGLMVAKQCKYGFGMNIIAFDPFMDKNLAAEMEIQLVDSMEKIFEKSDFVTLHIPLTAETFHMIGEKELKKMKKSAFLINCGRGGLVNEKDLIKALTDGEIAGAGLDVLEEEPPAQDNPLLKMRQVVLSPHSASLTEESKIKMAVGAAEQVIRVLKGEEPEFLVNPDAKKAPRA